MSHVEQFEKAVTEAGAVALRIERKPQGEERLVIQTRGGLITATKSSSNSETLVPSGGLCPSPTVFLAGRRRQLRSKPTTS
jgi:hypothetical protein